METHLGQCRCGAILRFRPGPSGYKMRCPKCGAGVRLRVETLPTTDYAPLTHNGAAGETDTPSVDVVSVANGQKATFGSRRFWIAAVGLMVAGVGAGLCWRWLR